MRRAVAALAGFFLALSLVQVGGCSGATAQAPGNVVTWTNPTARTDGTPFTTQASTSIAWGPKGGPYNVGSASVPAPGQTYTDATAYTGTRCYVAYAIDAPPPAGSGLPSDASNEVCKAILAKPAAPAGLAVK